MLSSEMIAFSGITAATFLNQDVTSLLAVSGTGHYSVVGNINNFGSSASGGEST